MSKSNLNIDYFQHEKILIPILILAVILSVIGIFIFDSQPVKVETENE